MGPRRGRFLSLPREDTEGRWPLANQGAHPSWSLTMFQKCDKELLVVYIIHSTVFRDSIQNCWGHRHMKINWPSLLQCLSVFFNTGLPWSDVWEDAILPPRQTSPCPHVWLDPVWGPPRCSAWAQCLETAQCFSDCVQGYDILSMGWEDRLAGLLSVSSRDPSLPSVACCGLHRPTVGMTFGTQ